MIDNFWAGLISGILFGVILDNGARMLYAWWQVHGRTPVVQGVHVGDELQTEFAGWEQLSDEAFINCERALDELAKREWNSRDDLDDEPTPEDKELLMKGAIQ